MLKKMGNSCSEKLRGRLLALYKKCLKLKSEAYMSVLNVTFSKLSSKKPAYHVGHMLYSRTKRKALF